MKKILSTVLALCMILGCVAAGFTAQAATEADLQAGINAAIAGSGEYNWTGGNIQLTKPLTINGNVKVNFNGATILGAPHKNTIVINGGKVELINADVEGTDAVYHYISGFIDEVSNACPTILIGNANVTLTNMVVTGAYIRVVGTYEDPVEIPMSDAITMGNANAVLTLNNVRAFGNNGVENLYGSKVNVVDCLVGGYINDFYSDANVSYAANTTQYSGFDLFKEALADEITLTEGEAELISKVLGRWMEVTASVKNQNYVEPTYSYDADSDTLTVTATADKSYDVQAECAFDYYYIPKTATILGVTKDFVKTGALTYTATFENIGPETVCDTALVYKLGVDMSSDAQTLIDDAIDMLEDFIATIPGMIETFADDQADAIARYLNGEQGFATILWNAYNEMGIEDLLADYNTQIADAQAQIDQLPEGSTERADAEAALAEAQAEKAQAEADIKALFGPVFDICGYSLKGNATIDSILAGIANGTILPGSTKYTRAANEIATMNNTYGCHLDVETGALGYIDVYLNYFNTFKDLAVANGQFNDIQGLGEYIGANYLDFYNFLKEMGQCAHRIADLFSNPDSFIATFIEDNAASISQYTSLIGEAVGYIDSGFAYVDNMLNSSMYTSMVNKYGDQVPQLCGQYLAKAYDIVSNPTTYIDIETDGDLVEGFAFDQTATYTTPADEVKATVTVNIHGYGKYSVKNTIYTTTQTFDVAIGDEFTVTPVEMDNNDPLFKYYSIGDRNGNEKLSPTGGTITVYNDTVINVNFSWDSSVYEITFMTNYELSSRWLDTINSDEVADNGLPAIDSFEGATFLGWATQNVSGASAQAAELLMSNAQVIAAAENADENMTFYAIFSFPQTEVPTEILNTNRLIMTENFAANGKAYFTVLFSDRAVSGTIVEAGVIAAASESAINNATATTGTGIIRGKVDFTKYSLPLLYTYKVNVGNATNITVYAKGYVIIEDAEGNLTYDYTSVYEVAL